MKDKTNKSNVENDDVMSEEEENAEIDEDTCAKSELGKLFKSTYQISCEEATSLKKNYVLHLSASETFDHLAVGLSDKTLQIYKLAESSFTNVTSWKKNCGHYESPICGVRFFNNDENTLLCGTEDGLIDLIDLRQGVSVHSFEDKASGETKPITSLDINHNNRVLAAGTAQIQRDVFLLFFDIRQKSLLGGYWESHTDDITQVKFHPTNSNMLASGSTDGLVNIFDISQDNEDDALQQCLNTVSSVDKINWHKNVYEHDYISCITHTNDLSFYDVNESETFVEFSRDHITESIRRKLPSNCNLLGCHNGDNDEIFLLAASNYNRGECLRSLKLDNKSLTPVSNFTGNKQILRTSLYCHKNNSFITGGESSFISLWTSGEVQGGTASGELNSSLKDKCKLNEKNRKKKPY